MAKWSNETQVHARKENGKVYSQSSSTCPYTTQSIQSIPSQPTKLHHSIFVIHARSMSTIPLVGDNFADLQYEPSPRYCW